MPSAVVDTILAPACPNRLQTDVNIAATYYPSVSRNPRRAPSLDSSPAGGKYRAASPDLGRSASAPATVAAGLQHQLPPAVSHSYLSSPSPSRELRGSPSHPQLSSSLPSTIHGLVSPCIARDNNSSFDWSPPPSLAKAPASRPIPLEPSHGAWSPPGLGTGAASAPLRGSIPFSTSLPLTATQGPDPALPDSFLSALPLSYPAGTAISQASPSYVGLSPSPGPGPVLVSRTAPPTTTAIGFNPPYTWPLAASIKSDSVFSVPQSACPLASAAPNFESGTFSGAFPTAISALPPGSVSPLYLGAGATPVAALSGPVSDGTVASPQTGSDTVESLRHQLSFLIQAWMADRESSRPAKEQTEEVLHRMHIAMESGREQWTSDRTAMQRELESLNAQVYQLKQENATLKAAAARINKRHSFVSRAGRRGTYAPTSSSSPSDPDDPAAASLSSQSGSSRAYIFSPPPRFGAAPRRTHIATPGSSRTSPCGLPAPSHVSPLGPRSQPRHSAAVDFMDPLARNGKGPPAPIIDVREIDPRLEGIPLRANAVQRSTFAPAPAHSSLAIFLRRGGQARDSAATRRTRRLSMDRTRFWRLRRTSSKDQTLQVLAAEESRRLTMHAGHTPNHSLSLLPTMTTTGGDSTGYESMRATPSAEARSVCLGRHGLADPGEFEDDETSEDAESDQDALADIEDCRAGLGLELLEDKPLKGPLMVKNIPAHDDVFFAKLDRKLECLKTWQDALPSVLRESSPVREFGCRSPGVGEQPRQPVPAPPLGGDASHDTGSARESVDEGESGENDIEPDVPLKMKNTSNFGAPFGSA
ncbi:hypothetical protein HRG_004805 [Hirsutella rhossiliensis]|uniref:Uncharacterized protein n=1 Tax=Hirsutella rhossiliensis TaxID=111463 RepID=A0A9P8N479_9HYPO|nr:uncharacterized protein HRG_04805 [Hirsutella rhossiliensis]KAH0964377.1 hypothetical protein HRG_04805 [Hirsutella rhossiliensis]